VLGDESFVQKVRDRLSKMGRGSREIKSARRMEPAIGWEQVVQRVAKKYRVEKKQLIEGEHGLEARNVAMWMLWEGGGRTLREIGELFGGIDYAAVVDPGNFSSPGTLALLAVRIGKTRLIDNHDLAQPYPG